MPFKEYYGRPCRRPAVDLHIDRLSYHIHHVASAKHPTLYPTDRAKTYSVLTPVEVGEGQESSDSAAIVLPEREDFADVPCDM